MTVALEPLEPMSLPPRVEKAVLQPPQGRRGSVLVADTTFSYLEWGDQGDPAVMLIHGARGSAQVWWRVGPGLAQLGRHVVAVDMPGHGRTPTNKRLAPFTALASALGAIPESLGLSAPVDVIATSWGALVATKLSSQGLVPGRLVLVEPPDLTAAGADVSAQLTETPGRTLDETLERVKEWHPDWDPIDQRIKADSLQSLDFEMLYSIIQANSRWDGGIEGIVETLTAGGEVFIVRGSPELGGLTPDSFIATLGDVTPDDDVSLRVRVAQIPEAGHVPQRTHPLALVAYCAEAIKADAST